MKVVLLQDVAKIGRKHAVVEVPDGYAQNQLIPSRKAKPATPENLKAALREAEHKQAAAEVSLAKYHATRKALADRKVVINAPNKNPQGHLFAAIPKGEVVEALHRAGVIVDPTMVELPHVIKETGEHEVHLVHGSEKSTFIIKVE